MKFRVSVIGSWFAPAKAKETWFDALQIRLRQISPGAPVPYQMFLMIP